MVAQQEGSSQSHQHTFFALYRQPLHCYILADIRIPVLWPVYNNIISQDTYLPYNHILRGTKHKL